MAQPPEIELIDQLTGSDMPLIVMIGLFAREVDARRVISFYIEKGIVSLFEGGKPLPKWRALSSLRDLSLLDLQATEWILALTDDGAQAFESGNWARL